MEYLYKRDLEMLATLCDDRTTDCTEIIADEKAGDFSKALANLQMEYLQTLSAKLRRVYKNDSKRVGIK